MKWNHFYFLYRKVIHNTGRNPIISKTRTNHNQKWNPDQPKKKPRNKINQNTKNGKPALPFSVKWKKRQPSETNTIGQHRILTTITSPYGQIFNRSKYEEIMFLKEKPLSAKLYQTQYKFKENLIPNKTNRKPKILATKNYNTYQK